MEIKEEATQEIIQQAKKRAEEIVQKANDIVNTKAKDDPEINIETETKKEIIKLIFEDSENRMFDVLANYIESLQEYSEGMTLEELASMTDFVIKRSEKSENDIISFMNDLMNGLYNDIATFSDPKEPKEASAAALEAAEKLAEINRMSIASLNKRLNTVIKKYQEQIEVSLKKYLKDHSEESNVSDELLAAFIDALTAAETEEEPAAIYAAMHYLEKDQSGNLTPEAREAAKILKSAHEKAKRSISDTAQDHENKSVPAIFQNDIMKVIADNWVKIHQSQVTNELSFVKPKFSEKANNGLYKSQKYGNSDLMLAAENMIRNGGDITQFDTTARIFLEYVFELFYGFGGKSTFVFSIEEYSKRCKITTKQVYERLSNLMKTFENIKISFPGIKGFIRILNILYQESYVRVSFTTEFYEYISSQNKYSMYASTYMQTINTKFNPHTYYILKKLSFDKHMQAIGKQKSNNHSIAKLLEYAIELPNENDVNRKYKEKIMKPFIRDLNKLITDGIIDIKLYNGNDEITIENAQKLKFSEFKTLTYNCELINYPKKIEPKSN